MTYLPLLLNLFNKTAHPRTKAIIIIKDAALDGVDVKLVKLKSPNDKRFAISYREDDAHVLIPFNWENDAGRAKILLRALLYVSSYEKK